MAPAGHPASKSTMMTLSRFFLCFFLGFLPLKGRMFRPREGKRRSSRPSAAHYQLKVVYIVPCNGEYAVLKEFALLENTPNVPALDLPALDIVSTAKGFGCAAIEARTREEIQAAFSKALSADGPTVIAVPIKHQIRPLVPPVSAS
jgi:Thiamine pyrophosphate enzyme, C-terminal TPP binding domain